eukprot:2904153-Rhodomonas_salina.2
MELRASYAMPGTDLAHRAISLRTSYAMFGTDLAYRVAARCTDLGFRATSLRVSYAMSGTDLAYGAGARGSAHTVSSPPPLLPPAPRPHVSPKSFKPRPGTAKSEREF